VTVDGTAAGWMPAADVAAVTAARPRGTVALPPAFDQYVVAAPRAQSAVLAERRRAASIGRRAGCRRCCSSTGASRASAATSTGAAG
jgi:hypothetical protein